MEPLATPSPSRLVLSAALLFSIASPAFAGTKSAKIKKSAAPISQNASAPDPEFDSPDDRPKSSDPLEKLNRGTFAVNHQIYRFLLRPLAKGTEFIFPKPVLDGIGNAFDNIESPIRIVGSLLQANFQRAAKETGKLLVNSTFGVGGLMKPSDTIPALTDVPTEDVGQAFGKWGVPSGPYIVLPILGPSSCRDLPGKVADTALTPSSWIGTDALRYSLNTTRTVQLNPSRIKTYDLAREGALDEYIAVRESYLSYRAEAVRR